LFDFPPPPFAAPPEPLLLAEEPLLPEPEELLAAPPPEELLLPPELLFDEPPADFGLKGATASERVAAATGATSSLRWIVDTVIPEIQSVDAAKGFVE
jgi:hypothetical protein